eukprot:TRINITY_DN5803_c0_g1_i1.p1 TRINITY_DN5803_c0_g1~~TRINITY_DN5803_c0_g1_i1.p1  ORF type:complete len:422 (-),score=70.29 TRINITY_DN5803_c0_g1_i1:16-1281(-)
MAAFQFTLFRNKAVLLKNGKEQDRIWLDAIGEHLRIKDPSDWYGVSPGDIKKAGGSILLSKYQNSIYWVLKSLYGEHEWHFDKFISRVPNGYWDRMENKKDFLISLEKRLGFSCKEDWYNVKPKDIENCGGTTLYFYHNKNLFHLFESVFPEHQWEYSRFFPVDKITLDRIGQQLKIDKMEDWYDVNMGDLHRHGGSPLLHKHDRSMFVMLKNLYPNYQWRRWRFKPLSNYCWTFLDTLEGKKDFVEYLSERFQISRTDDWYRISLEQMFSIIPKTVLEKYSLFSLLEAVFPDYPWEQEKFNRKQMKASQRNLAKLVQQLFPSSEIKENFWDPSICTKTGRTLELDIFLPKEKLALEYQGEGHFHEIYADGDSSRKKTNDNRKRLSCQQVGITLVQVPYWWDQTLTTLSETIRTTRSDLLK